MIDDSIEVVYSTSFQPDPSNALDVLAFVLTPVDAFVSGPDDRAAVAEILGAAKREAVALWLKAKAGSP